MKTQIELFEYQRKSPCSCSKVPSEAQGEYLNSVHERGRPAARSALDLTGVVSRLEEVKFGRFCRHVLWPDGNGDEDDRERTVSLDFSDAEVHLTSIEDTNNVFSGHFFNQIVHLAVSLCSGEAIEDYFEDRLHAALWNFRGRSELLETLDGTRTHNFYQNNFGQSDHRIPEDYFLVTNVCHDVFRHGGDCPAHFSRLARSLFRRVLEIPDEYCPGFHVITPETIFASYGRPDAEDFLVDLLNTPSSYYLVAREGRISVIPSTECGTVFASPSGEVRDPYLRQGLRTMVTRSVAPSNPVDSLALSEFELLLNDRRTKEADLQRFLGAHPQFLFTMDQRYCEIRPHVCLYDSRGERLVPDFMARIQGSNIWDVIELKLPFTELTVRYLELEKASAAAARGIAELLRHRDYFGSLDNRRRIRRRFGIAAYEPCLVLVIGRGRTAQRFEWNTERAGFPNVQIVSYDFLFERARQMCRDFDGLKGGLC
jgi:hypothetical protein